jgi:hypothetical protein
LQTESLDIEPLAYSFIIRRVLKVGATLLMAAFLRNTPAILTAHDCASVQI